MRYLASTIGLIGICLSLIAVPVAANGNSRAQFDKAIESAKMAMMADPKDALEKTDAALKQADKLSGDERAIGRATALWLNIEANIGLNRLDKAKENLSEALALVKDAAPDTKLHGDLMRSQGAIAALNGKASDALRHYLDAHRIFRRAGERRSQAIALQDIGQIYWEAGDYDRMLAYFDEAQEIYDDDPAFSLTTNNNRGEAFRILGRRNEAEAAFTKALVNARALKSAMLETRILSNLAMVQIENGKLKEAEKNANLAQTLGNNEEARDWLPFVYGVKAKLAAVRGNDPQALMYLERLFAGVDLKTTDVTFKEFHQLAADVYARREMPALALSHLQAFQRLDSESKNLVTSASSQLLEARFNSVNQKTRIAERDIKIERQRRDLVTGLLLAALAIIIVGGYAFFSVRRSRNKVRETNGILTNVNARLEHALKAKSDFLAMTSHEIRTPLNGIMGMSQVILADQELDTRTRERMGLVMGAGKTMQALVDDLLDAAKMENSNIAVKSELVDLRSILRDCVQLWKAEATVKGLELDFVDEASATHAMTDGGRFRQVIFNLCANAIKFTPSGKVRVIARNGDANSLTVSIEDEGIGIPAEEFESIFQPFHQVDNGMSREHSGAGLGLAICRNIITTLGGTITVESEVGKGSIFRVTIPVTETPAVAQKTSASGGSAGNGAIIVVDGNELRLAKIKAVIMPNVGSVVAAQSLESANENVAARPIDVALIDTTSLAADKNGLLQLGQFMTTLREKNIQTIFLKATDDTGTSDPFHAFQPDVILVKPVKASAILQAIDNLLIPEFRQADAA